MNTKIPLLIESVRNRPPKTSIELADWVRQYTRVRIPNRLVCVGHAAPLAMFSHHVLERPSLALWHGLRGSGKSFLSAIDTHLCSRFKPQ